MSRSDTPTRAYTGLRKQGGATGTEAAPAITSAVTIGTIALVVAVVAAAIAITAVIPGSLVYHQWDEVKDLDDLYDWQDDIDDVLKVSSDKSAVNILTNLTVDGDITATGSQSMSSYSILDSFLVCSDGDVTEGNVVSLNEGCITDGYDPYPSFIYDTAELGVITKNVLVHLGGGNAISLYTDSIDVGAVSAKNLFFENGAFVDPVVSVDIGGTTIDDSTWVGVGVDDGTTLFTARTGDGDDSDIIIYRSVHTATSATVDSGVSIAVVADIAIVDMIHLGSDDTTHFFAILFINDGTDTLNTLTFHTTTTFDDTIVFEATPIVIDTNPNYEAAYDNTLSVPGHLVNLNGANSAFTFGVIYGGIINATEISMVVHTIGGAPSTIAAPIQTIISTSPHVIHTRDVGTDNWAITWAAVAPGTNNVVLLVSDYSDREHLILYSVSANPNVLLTTVVFSVPTGQRTNVQPWFSWAHFMYPDDYQLECLSPTVCIIAFRSIHDIPQTGKVASLELSVDGDIERINHQTSFAPGMPSVNTVSLIAVSPHHFYVGFAEPSPVDGKENAKVVRGVLPTSNSERGEIHFGLGAAGRAPLGIATESCTGATDCVVHISGFYQLPESTPFGTLGHVSNIFAYCDGRMGLPRIDYVDPFCPSVKIGVHVGSNRILTTPSGLFEPL